MASYRVKYRTSVEKEIRSVPKDFADNIALRLDSLSQNPFPVDCRKLAGEEAYRIRVGNYRIIYTVDIAEKIVMIERVRHRKDVYRKF